MPPRTERPDAQQDAADFARYLSTRDPALREVLVRRFLPLARHLAGRYAGNADRDDLEQVASVALLKAIERFDPERGLAFSSFAVPTILGELKRYFRDLGWTVRESSPRTWCRSVAP
jgi:RNA polymerase sigma-B factor